MLSHELSRTLLAQLGAWWVDGISAMKNTIITIIRIQDKTWFSAAIGATLFVKNEKNYELFMIFLIIVVEFVYQ